jgi:hypothetical protein
MKPEVPMLEHLTAVSIAAFAAWGLIFVVWPLVVIIGDRMHRR